MQNTLKILTSEDCIEFDREALDMFKHYSMDLSLLRILYLWIYLCQGLMP